MAFFRTSQVLVLAVFLLASPAFASRTHRSATSGHKHRVIHRHEIRGQRGIDSERAREIQSALIREHYLTGPASGQWDSSTEAAMQKYQADHGWQTKLTPDSRALIKLGLGPKETTAQAAPAVPVSSTTAPSAAPLPPSPSANTLADAHTLQN